MEQSLRTVTVQDWHRSTYGGDENTPLFVLVRRGDLTYFAVRRQGPRKKKDASYCCLLHGLTMFGPRRLRMMYRVIGPTY